MKIIGIHADYNGNCIILREDYSFANLSTRDVFDQLVKGVNKFTNNISLLHDYERAGIVRVDYPEQGRGRIFPTYAEYIHVASSSISGLLSTYYDQSKVDWIDSFQPVAHDYYHFLNGDNLPAHFQQTVNFAYQDEEVLELFLRLVKHQRNKIKRQEIPSPAILSPKKKNYTIRFKMNKLLTVKLSESFYKDVLATAS